MTRDSARPRPPAHASRARRPADEFDAAAANLEMAHKLQHHNLRRLARAHGLELRHSAYGYSLINAARRRVDNRNDLTLDEVAVHLAAPPDEG